MAKTRRSRKQSYSLLAALGVIVFLLIIAALLQTLGIQVRAGIFFGSSFGITGPDKLVLGGKAQVTWNTSPENAQRYPQERIDFCTGFFFGQGCVPLATVANNGKAEVMIPATLAAPGSKGYIRLSALKNGRVQPFLSSKRRVEVVAASANPVLPPPTAPGSGDGPTFRPGFGCPAKIEQGRIPTEFQSGNSRYSRGACEEDPECFKGGCSGEVCTNDAENGISTCEFCPTFPKQQGLTCGCLPEKNVCGWR